MQNKKDTMRATVRAELEKLIEQHKSAGTIPIDTVAAFIEKHCPEEDSCTESLLIFETIEKAGLITEDSAACGMAESGAECGELHAANVPGVNCMQLFLQEIGSIPLLTRQQEQELGLKIANGDRQALNDMVSANMRLVVSTAKAYAKNTDIELQDLIQEGSLGLMRAAEKFDYTRGTKFSTYATWWIRQSITRALYGLGHQITLPAHAVEKINKLHRIKSQLEQTLGRTPTHKELADATNTPLTQVSHLLWISAGTTSLNAPVTEDEDSSVGQFIPDPRAIDPEFLAASTVLHETLDTMLKELSPRDAAILRYRYGLKDGRVYTLEEVGSKFGLTRERVRQIEHRALNSLRKPYRIRKLQDLLV